MGCEGTKGAHRGEHGVEEGVELGLERGGCHGEEVRESGDPGDRGRNSKLLAEWTRIARGVQAGHGGSLTRSLLAGSAR